MIIGTAGHIDHGKTSLVKALTGVDADRLKEEKARGITIDLGYAYTPLPNGDVLGFVDVPGHEKLVHNMLAGATGIDYVLLVIAADDGSMPQTREHLAILDLLGLNCGAVALTKIDRVAPERIAAVMHEIHGLLAGTGLDNSPIFPLSAITGQGVAELRAHLDITALELPKRSRAGHFRLAVDRAFTIAGTGTVVTGTVFSGAVHIGDKLIVSPTGIEVRVRGIHAQNQVAESGHAGQRCALNLAGIQFEKNDVHRGDWLLEVPVHAPSQRFDAQFHLLATEQKALKHWTPVHLHIGASDVMARLAILEGDSIEPGGTALVQLITDKPICPLNGDRFILRDQSANRTLGGGKVLDPFPPARNRRTPARIAALQAMHATQHDEALALAMAVATTGLDLTRFAQSRNIRSEEAQQLWRSLPMQVVTTPSAEFGFTPAYWLVLKQTVLARLSQEHAENPDFIGPDRTRLQRMALPALPRPVFAALLDELLGSRQITQSGPWLHLPDHKVTLSAAEEKQWQMILPLLQAEPYQPPRVRDIANTLSLDEDNVRMLLRRVARVGDVYLVAHDHYFTKQAVAQLSNIIKEIAVTRDGISAAEFRDQINTGRKLAIQILEFFNRIVYTRRTGDKHRLRQESASMDTGF
ncbi:selenocysteine-specific translation elongation factor [Sulfuriferula thiophila]|uniref:selenocysteine-specific translation elongation factor n=1 Tax=Sulfuriferula thiophila TaxID=1781211 RepID=UPI000F60E69D|nr:selenocysteine-specific translation elongation factor [Sulfuriferula thiophila]